MKRWRLESILNVFLLHFIVNAEVCVSFGEGGVSDGRLQLEALMLVAKVNEAAMILMLGGGNRSGDGRRD